MAHLAFFLRQLSPSCPGITGTSHINQSWRKGCHRLACRQSDGDNSLADILSSQICLGLRCQTQTSSVCLSSLPLSLLFFPSLLQSSKLGWNLSCSYFTNHMWPSNRKLWMLRGIILISTLHASTSTCPKNWKDILSLRHCHKFRNDWGVSSHHVNILTRPKYSLVKWVWIQALLLPFESPHHTHTHKSSCLGHSSPRLCWRHLCPGNGKCFQGGRGTCTAVDRSWQK